MRRIPSPGRRKDPEHVWKGVGEGGWNTWEAGINVAGAQVPDSARAEFRVAAESFKKSATAAKGCTTWVLVGSAVSALMHWGSLNACAKSSWLGQGRSLSCLRNSR